MADIDFKQIGLAAKDIIIGVGAAAAGATGGPAAAEGVMKAGSGLDRILNMAGVEESRADKFDRADYAARPQMAAGTKPPAASPPPEGAPAPQTTPQARPASIASNGTGSSGVPEEQPLDEDAKITAEYLRSLGWPADKIHQILSGPEETPLAAIVGKQTTGVRTASVNGTRLTPVEGAALPSRSARVIPSVDGQAIPTLTGVRIRSDTSGA